MCCYTNTFGDHHKYLRLLTNKLKKKTLYFSFHFSFGLLCHCYRILSLNGGVFDWSKCASFGISFVFSLLLLFIYSGCFGICFFAFKSKFHSTLIILFLCYFIWNNYQIIRYQPKNQPIGWQRKRKMQQIISLKLTKGKMFEKCICG